MECIKCGRETDQTFCAQCRETMKDYPVKPGSVVQLPKSKPDYAQRRNVRRTAQITPEMQVEQLKKKLRKLWVTVVCLCLVIALLCTGLFLLYRRSRQPLPGQNYSVTHPTEAAEQ